MSEAAQPFLEPERYPSHGLPALIEQQAKSQAFFAEYALQARAPHAGDFFKQFVTDMLARAKTAGLYTETE